MEWFQEGQLIFVRLDPGARVVASLVQLSEEAEIEVAAIISGVGMLDHVQMGFFDVAKDDYDVTDLAGPFDLSSVLGNITRRDGQAVPHVHAVFNRPDFSTASGHVIEASVHITLELFLSRTRLDLERVKLSGCPATRIVSRH